LLIIFDLDDTLIDTSGSVTPFKLQKVAEKMLGRKPTAIEMKELLLINASASKTQEAIQIFANRYKLFFDEEFLELTSPLPNDFQIPCTPYAKEVLEKYRKTMILTLVTGGHRSFQLEKLEKAGIDASLFSKIAIPEDSMKKPFYQEISREFSVDPSKMWVCGDRILMDLKPAFELGCKTIHMRWGRGLNMALEPWIDFSISNLGELQRIIP